MQTVDVMRGVATSRSRSPLIRQVAIGILNYAGTASQDYYSEAMAIGNFVHQRIAYVKDPTDMELLVDPITLLEQADRGQARGDCDDMSLLTASLLLAIGHDPFFRCVRYNGGSFDPFSHIYVVDRLADGDLVIDAIVKNKPIGFEVPHDSQEDFPCLDPDAN